MAFSRSFFPSIAPFNNSFISDTHATIKFENGYCILKRNNKAVVYVNNVSVLDSQVYLKNGDVSNIYGLKIIPAFGILFINNPFGQGKLYKTVNITLQGVLFFYRQLSE